MFRIKIAPVYSIMNLVCRNKYKMETCVPYTNMDLFNIE